MRYFRLLLGLLCLFGFASMASGATNITVTSTHSFDVLPDGNRYRLGTATVGQATTVNLTVTNVSGQAERVTASSVLTDGVTAGGTIVTTGTGITGGTTVSPGTAAEFSVTGPTKGTINLASTSNGLEASFSGTGEAIAIGGNISLTLSVKPLLAGNLTVLINFSQIVTGDDGYFYFTLTAVNPPPPPPPIKPYVSFFLDAPDLTAGAIRVPAHLVWGGNSPVLVLNPDYSKIVWKKNGQAIATGKDPLLEVAVGDTITVVAVSMAGVTYSSDPVIFALWSPTPPPAFNPGESGYHPKPKPRQTSQASGLVKTTRRAKPTGVEGATWGEIKNMEK